MCVSFSLFDFVNGTLLIPSPQAPQSGLWLEATPHRVGRVNREVTKLNLSTITTVYQTAVRPPRYSGTKRDRISLQSRFDRPRKENTEAPGAAITFRTAIVLN